MGYVLPTQYPAKLKVMEAKLIKLLPSPKLLPSEWVLVSAILEGQEIVFHGMEIRFEQGVCYTSEEGAEEWGWQDPIREMDVDQDLVRYNLNNYKYSRLETDKEDSARCLFWQFAEVAWCPTEDYSTSNY